METGASVPYRVGGVGLHVHAEAITARGCSGVSGRGSAYVGQWLISLTWAPGTVISSSAWR